MKVSFAEITTKGLHKQIVDARVSAEPGVVFHSRPEVDIRLSRSDESTAALSGRMRVVMEMACSRCLRPVIFNLEFGYDYLFRLGEDISLSQKEVECNDEDCATVYLQEPIIDIDEVIQEQWILAVPAVPLCSEKCKGLCYRCGALLDNDPCTCVEENTDSPFAKLKNLKK